MRRADLQAGHGLTPYERTVMDRWDAGVPVAAIAAETGYPLRAVERLVRMYAVSAVDVHTGDARRGSAALLAAIRQHHPEMVR